MNGSEEEVKKRFFTDLDGLFKARLVKVEISRRREEGGTEFGTTSGYLCRIIAEYNRELVRLLDDGMLVAVRNFRTKGNEKRFTLMEIVRFWPEHFGLRGLREYHYYPIQFEVVEQSVVDWETSDTSTMIINIVAIPINYDLVVYEDGNFDFEKGFSFPVVGDEVLLLNAETIKQMYNKGIAEKYENKVEASLGVIKMFERFEKEKIPIFVDFDSLIRYHFGIFAFTGGGKSNLLSNIIRKIVNFTQNNKIIIFDISCEYPFLLMDVFANEKINSLIVLESKPSSVDDFFKGIVKPKKYEGREEVKKGFEKVWNLGRVTFYTERLVRIPTFSDILLDIERYRKKNEDKPVYREIFEELETFVREYMAKNNMEEGQEITEGFLNEFINKCNELSNRKGVYPRSEEYGWLTGRDVLKQLFEKKEEEIEMEGVCVDEIIDMLENPESDVRIICISISEPETIKSLAMDISRKILLRRKREFKTVPQILFVFDEAQEFVAQPNQVRGIDKECSEELEKLLRQGRKYGLGACIATQRIAYLNTNVLQQLHTYFVSTLPRTYDRSVVSNQFMIDRNIVDKVLEFVPGEWLLSSYVATGISNVPIFIKAENSEKEIDSFIET